MKNCKFCLNMFEKTKIKKIYFNLPIFRHYDFSTIKEGKIYFEQCSTCSTIFNDKYYQKEKKIFKKLIYLSNSEVKYGRIYKNNRFELKQYSQAKIIKRFFNKNDKLNFLDVGCFDGTLLKELNKNFKKSSFFGLEISSNFKKIFPKYRNFNFFDDIKKVKEFGKKIDCVIFSDSIMYIEKLDELLKNIYEILNDNGIIFIQNPNIKNNSLTSLIGDQFIIPTETTLRNIFSLFQFKIKKKISNNTEKNQVFIAKKTEVKNVKLKKDKTIIESLKKNKLLGNNIIKYKKFNLFIFGATLSAAFVDQTLSNSNSFLDENPLKVGKYFRNNKVYHPSLIKKNSNVILAYGKFNNIFKKKLKSKYKLNLITV